jgi:hypothetical protein
MEGFFVSAADPPVQITALFWRKRPVTFNAKAMPACLWAPASALFAT